MKEFYSYVRVSTTRQEEEGVSLQQQKEANERCAARCGVKIIELFEESETAAKHGRPVFSRMLKLLKAGKASGVIIHKIDRSARNLRDWADLGELIDSGIEVYFANESLDLRSRGGRLAADIQAVVASDFIRNLREETKKGFYGRLKQGLLPLPAPVGYLNQGKGKPKIIDPEKAPLVRLTFELYATGRYSLEQLVEEMYKRGLRSRKGKKIGHNGMSLLLNRRFYAGEIEIKKSGERFSGQHEALIPVSLFERVQDILAGKYPKRVRVHNFTFRRLLCCASCGYFMIGETHKGYVYYRCQTKKCATTAIRQEDVERTLVPKLRALQFSETEKQFFAAEVQKMKLEWAHSRGTLEHTLAAELERLSVLSERLLDAFLEGTLEKDLFEQKKRALSAKRREIEGQLKDSQGAVSQQFDALENFLELAGNAYLLYKIGSNDKKRELVEMISSNRLVRAKNVEFSWNSAAEALSDRPNVPDGSPPEGATRTNCTLLRRLADLLLLSPSEYPMLPKLKHLRYS